MSDKGTPPSFQGPDDNEAELVTTPIPEPEPETGSALFAGQRPLFIAVAVIVFLLVVAAGSIGFFVGRTGEEPGLVAVSDGRAETMGPGDTLDPAEAGEILSSFFVGTLETKGGEREALTLRFGEAEFEGRGWLQAQYVMNGPSHREKGVALLQPAATRLLLGSGEGFEVGRNAWGQLVVRGGDGRRVRMTSESP